MVRALLWYVATVVVIPIGVVAMSFVISYMTGNFALPFYTIIWGPLVRSVL
jgi:hypothetical protein